MSEKIEKFNSARYLAAVYIVGAMRHRTAVWFCIMMWLAISFGCAARHGELKGEVFIVTKGAGNLKLGLVEIALIPEAEINTALEKKKPIIGSTLEQLKSDSEKASAEYSSVHQAYLKANESYLKAEKDYLESAILDEQAKRRAEYWQSEYSKLVKADSEKRSKKDQADIKLKQFPTAEFFFEGLPSGIAKTITNSNGEFLLTLPSKGKFALAARAAREVPPEKYYWLIWVSLDGEASKTILLSNHNLITAESPDSVVRAKAMSF